jgi:hypothetical protein
MSALLEPPPAVPPASAEVPLTKPPPVPHPRPSRQGPLPIRLPSGPTSPPSNLPGGFAPKQADGFILSSALKVLPGQAVACQIHLRDFWAKEHAAIMTLTHADLKISSQSASIDISFPLDQADRRVRFDTLWTNIGGVDFSLDEPSKLVLRAWMQQSITQGCQKNPMSVVKQWALSLGAVTCLVSLVLLAVIFATFLSRNSTDPTGLTIATICLCLSSALGLALIIRPSRHTLFIAGCLLILLGAINSFALLSAGTIAEYWYRAAWGFVLGSACIKRANAASDFQTIPSFDYFLDRA